MTWGQIHDQHTCKTGSGQKRTVVPTVKIPAEWVLTVVLYLISDIGAWVPFMILTVPGFPITGTCVILISS